MSKDNTDEFVTLLSAQLDEYSSEVQEIVNNEVEDLVEEGKRKIKELSPVGSRTKNKYKNGWRTNIVKSYSGIEAQIGNKQFQLTHLLEHGHLTVNKTSRTKAIPHVGPTQKWVGEELERRLKSKL